MTPVITTDEKTKSTFRRILLSKQLYLHGLEHSYKADALDKMIAVHNFHNSIEIGLRAIILHYEIRAEKELNIAFEVMLNEIDKHDAFKKKDIRLPFRQELRNLNQLRNLVQHHGVEPPSATMEDWRVFTRSFLEKICEMYFNITFEDLSPIEMINDQILKDLLRLSKSSIEEKNLKKSAAFSKIAFEWASKTVLSFLPESRQFDSHGITSPFHDRTGPNRSLERAMQKAFETALEKVSAELWKVKKFTVLLSSGINIVDYKKFEMITPSVDFLLDGSPYLKPSFREMKVDEETTKWAHDFVVSTIIHWQTFGLTPSVPDDYREAAEEFSKNGSINLEF